MRTVVRRFRLPVGLRFPTMFGEVLRKARHAADLTQEKLAFRAGFDRTYVSLLERGRRQPTLDAVIRLSEALGLLPSELVMQVEEALKIKKPKKRR